MENNIQRTFIPGSEWFYIKLYVGINYADQIITRCIQPCVNELFEKSLITKWFFVRYEDPDFHLRLRFLLQRKTKFETIINALYKPISDLIANEIIWKIQIDSYKRELERYQGELIEESETIFFLDSETILKILTCIKKNQDESYRWLISLKMIDSLLNDFSLDLSSKYKLMNELSISFKEEFGFNEYNSKQFNIKYRNYKNTIASHLENKTSDTIFCNLCNIVSIKSDEMRNTIHSIRRRSANDQTIKRLLPSYIHMMFNRLFLSRNRVFELVIYDFMRRYYMSLLAKKQ